MRRIGIAPEPRKFTPHVTLGAAAGRLLHGCRRISFHARLFSCPAEFEAKRFVLFSSRASTGGGPYVVEAAYPLG